MLGRKDVKQDTNSCKCFIDPKTYVGPFDILNLEYQALN